jgi:hypothetical protein
MASRMKVWIGLVAGGILLIGLWGVPPRSYEEWRGSRWGSNRDPLPEREAYERVAGDIYLKNWIYQRLQWRDSVAALARTAREAGPLWRAAVPDSSPEWLLPGLERAIGAQLSAEEVHEPRVPVGVVFMEFLTGTYPSLSRGYSRYTDAREVYVGLQEDAPYCFLVVPVPGPGTILEGAWNRAVWAPADSSSAPNPLGPCALHAKYGTPGQGVLAWLARGGYATALGRSRSILRYPDSELSSRAFLELSEVSPRALLALGRRVLWYRGSPEAEACLAGKVQGCRTVLLEGMASSWWSGGRQEGNIEDSLGLVTRIPEHGFQLPFEGREYGLLWDLEAEFGPERFQIFWGSELGMEEAFRSAFGVGAPEWVMAWGQKRLGRSKVGATVPAKAAALSFLTIGVLAGGALLLGRRRG